MSELDPYIARIREEKGDSWCIAHGYGGSPRQMLASLIYHHFRETDEGKAMWAADAGEDKVQDIYDRIYDLYMVEGFVPEKVWLEDADANGMTIDNYLYEEIDAGVN